MKIQQKQCTQNYYLYKVFNDDSDVINVISFSIKHDFF